MKKLIFSALVATTLFVSSCGKDDDNGGGSTSLNGIGMNTCFSKPTITMMRDGNFLILVQSKLFGLYPIKR